MNKSFYYRTNYIVRIHVARWRGQGVVKILKNKKNIF